MSVSDLMKRLLEMEIALSSPWAEEARKAHDEIERLTAVLDAARWICKQTIAVCGMPGERAVARAILRALDGEDKKRRMT